MTTTLEPAVGVTAGEQRLVLRGIDWRTYCVLRELLDSPGLRMAYLEGALELMTTSARHEHIKKMIARLVEMFAVERSVPLNGYGSTTFRREAKEAGLEPDECYVVGGELREAPDIALEVVLTSGGIPKLPIYQRLGVREVWFWFDGGFRLFGLGETGYEPIPKSGLVPDLDFELLGRFLDRPDQTQAVVEYRDALRTGRQ